MRPLKKRYSLLLIASSLAVLYVSGNFIISKIMVGGYVNDFSIATTDEDKKLSKNIDYLNAVSAFNSKDYNVAVDELKREIEKYPNHAQAYFLLGKIYEDVNFPEGKFYSMMVSNYEKYIELEPKGKRIDYVKLRVAQYYIQVGLREDKIEKLNKAEEYLKSLDQNNSDVKMALGAIYLDKKNYDQAIVEFEKSANLSPSELKIKYNSLGLAYIKKGAYGKAEKILEIAVKIDPKDKYAHNNLGFVYAAQGKLMNAKAQFIEALNLDPSYKNAEKNLNWVEREINKRKDN
jgi:tetratricopeptide (TPR) repeat protein